MNWRDYGNHHPDTDAVNQWIAFVFNQLELINAKFGKIGNHKYVERSQMSCFQSNWVS